MRYCRFIESLFDNGRVTVTEVGPLADDDLNSADALMVDLERQYRLEMPGEPPSFRRDAARWAGVKFFRACQFAVFRDVGEETLDEVLGEPFGEAKSPDICYSVDFVFRYLPGLAKLAHAAAERDPLLDHLLRWSREWPLSSVGMPKVGDVSIDAFAGNPSLLQLYADRVLAEADCSRLADPRVREIARSALGMFGDLNSGVFAALKNFESEGAVE